MSNSVYGQLLRNPRKDRHVELVRTAVRFRKLMAKPTTKGFKIFGDDLVLVERQPNKIRMDNLPAAGVAVLDLSKRLMMRLYGRLQDQFGPRMDLILTDTDSVCLELRTPDLVEDLRPLMDILDTSTLPVQHPLYDPQFARHQGRLKIEYGNFHIRQIAAVRSKVYALDLTSATGDAKVYKAKGVHKAALNRTVTFDDYKRCVFEGVLKPVTYTSIRTDGRHNLYTMRQTKNGLVDFDNKRFIMPCGIRTRAFGYRGREWRDNEVRPPHRPLSACMHMMRYYLSFFCCCRVSGRTWMRTPWPNTWPGSRRLRA